MGQRELDEITSKCTCNHFNSGSAGTTPGPAHGVAKARVLAILDLPSADRRRGRAESGVRLQFEILVEPRLHSDRQTSSDPHPSVKTTVVCF